METGSRRTASSGSESQRSNQIKTQMNVAINAKRIRRPIGTVECDAATRQAAMLSFRQSKTLTAAQWVRRTGGYRNGAYAGQYLLISPV